MSKQYAARARLSNPRPRRRAKLDVTSPEASLAGAMSAQLGVPVSGPADLLRLARGGCLTLDVVRSLRDHGLLAAEIHRVVIPQRTLTHRRATGQTHLSAEEADRAVRLARISALAERAFGERERGLRWLRKPKQFLGGSAPMDALASSEAARLVEEKLLQLEHGMVV